VESVQLVYIKLIDLYSLVVVVAAVVELIVVVIEIVVVAVVIVVVVEKVQQLLNHFDSVDIVVDLVIEIFAVVAGPKILVS
jgi:hypothetical protein